MTDTDQPQTDSMDLKKKVLILFVEAGVIKPGDTGQITIHVNCGGIRRIDKNAVVA